MLFSAEMTSFILSAETAALGSITDIIVSIKKDITICIAYVINAVIAPTCKEPSEICPAPTHMIRTVTRFIIIIIRGIINVIVRFVKSIADVRSLLALSKRSSSYFSRLKARITGRPVSISLATRFSLSTSFCISLNLGIAIFIRISTTARITITARAIIHAIPVPVVSTINTPPMPRIGAYITILSSITITICICCISFVLLVIRLAVENLSISALEKLTTLLKTPALRSLPTFAAVVAAKKPTVTDTAIIRSAISSIFPPADSR